MSAPPEEGCPWIRRFHPSSGAAVRLLCFPHAGGSASSYFAMSRELAPGIEVLAVQYPGRHERVREPPAGTVAELADRAAEAVRDRLDRPFAVFGHSLGASVGYETALRLQSLGRAPAAVFVSARRAPHRTTDTGVHRLPDDELVDRVRALSGTGAEVFEDAELLRLVLPALRADYRAAETYRRAAPGPGLDRPALDCDVQAFAGAADPVLPPGEMRHWAEHTSGPFGLRIFSGGHFYLRDHPTALARALARRLAEFGPADPGPAAGVFEPDLWAQ